MQVQPDSTLISVLTKLFSGGNASVDSSAPEFEAILAKLGAILESPGQRQPQAVKLVLPEVSQERSFVSEARDEIPEGTECVQVEAVLQKLPVAAMGLSELPGELRPLAAQDLEVVREELETLRAQVETVPQGLQTEITELVEVFNASGSSATQRIVEGAHEKLKSLRAYLKEAESSIVERQPTAEAEGEESQRVQLMAALAAWTRQKGMQEAGQSRAEAFKPSQGSESQDSMQATLAFLNPMTERVGPLPHVTARPENSIAAAQMPAQESLEEINALGSLEAPLAELVLPRLSTPGETDGSEQVALGVVSVDQKPQPAFWVERVKDTAGIESVESLPPEMGSMLESSVDGSFQPDVQVSEESLLKPAFGKPNLSAPSQLEPSLSSVLGSVGGATSAPAGGENRVALALPLGHPQWADELGQRLIWIHGKAIQAAEVHLNPPHLGPVAVRIEMHDEETLIQFASPHAAVREVIEAALPRLKELLDAHGLPVSQVEVAHKSLEDRSNAHGERSYASAHQEYQTAGEDGAKEPEQAALQLESPLGSRLLSLYV